MTTFSSQRKDPGVAKAEERLGEILTCLGKNRIPELEVGEFYEDLVKEPRSQGRLEAFEEQIGIRLGLRILDQVMLEQFNKVEELVDVENGLKEQVKKITEEKLESDLENRAMKTEIVNLKNRIKEAKSESQTLQNDHKSQASEYASLKIENQNLKSKLANLVKQYEQILCELRGPTAIDESEPKPELDAAVPVPKRTNSKKRKSPTPDDLSKTPVKSCKSRVFSRKLSPNEALLHSISTQAQMDDISFVPETLGIGESPKVPLPVPCRKISSVPETPEKQKSSSKVISKYSDSEQLVTPEKVQFKVSEVKIEPKAEKLPSSPVISRNLSRGGKKLRLNIREKGEGVNNPLPVPVRDRQESYKNSMKLSDDDKVRVGKVAPSVQSEIDKKSFQDLDIDFPAPKRNKKLAENPRKVAVPVAAPPSDTDSDFESPNLLVKKSRRRDVVNPVEKPEPEFKTPKVAQNTLQRKDSVDDIEIFASPDDKPAEPKKVPKKSKSIKEAANRWGIEVSDITNSQKKRLQNQKQSKIDGFFKNPPPRQNSDFIRINHADTDMERALKLSKEAEEEKNGDVEKDEINSPERSEEDIVEKVDKDQAGPGFAYIGEVVRTKEARQKLNGFDCRECGEYYQSKLEEGLSKDQIMKVLNKCSKHRGYFKPPLTPEKFWDADIVEGDPNSPRNKTQVGVPFRNRAKRRAEAKEKRKALKNIDNEN